MNTSFCKYGGVVQRLQSPFLLCVRMWSTFLIIPSNTFLTPIATQSTRIDVPEGWPGVLALCVPAFFNHVINAFGDFYLHKTHPVAWVTPSITPLNCVEFWLHQQRTHRQRLHRSCRRWLWRLINAIVTARLWKRTLDWILQENG